MESCSPVGMLFDCSSFLVGGSVRKAIRGNPYLPSRRIHFAAARAALLAAVGGVRRKVKVFASGDNTIGIHLKQVISLVILDSSESSVRAR